jgi:hypothetical protein
MQQGYHCPACGAQVGYAMVYCENCGCQLTWQQPMTETTPISRNMGQYAQHQSDEYLANETDGRTWVQRHLNWTYLIWICAIYACMTMVGIYVNSATATNTAIYAGGIWRWAIIPLLIFHIQANIWIIKRKGRSIWWFLPSIIFSPILLFLTNENE